MKQIKDLITGKIFTVEQEGTGYYICCDHKGYMFKIAKEHTEELRSDLTTAQIAAPELLTACIKALQILKVGLRHGETLAGPEAEVANLLEQAIYRATRT